MNFDFKEPDIMNAHIDQEKTIFLQIASILDDSDRILPLMVVMFLWLRLKTISFLLNFQELVLVVLCHFIP